MAKETKIRRFPTGPISPKVRLAQLAEHVDDLAAVYVVMKWRQVDENGKETFTWSTSYSTMSLPDLAMAYSLAHIDMLHAMKENYDDTLPSIGTGDDGPDAA